MGLQVIEYTTVLDLRSSYLGITQTDEDTLFLDRIRAASAMIDNNSLRSFMPNVQTQLYDVPQKARVGFGYVGAYYPGGYYGGSNPMDDLQLDSDLLSLTTLTNGDGTVIASSDYKLYPTNKSPKNRIALNKVTGVVWLGNAGDFEQVISVAGVWGFHENYASAWVDTGNTVNGAHTNTTTSLAYSGSATLEAGSLYKIGSEFVYHVSGTVTPLVISRGCNGSTAQAFVGGESISVWTPRPEIKEIATIAAWMLYKLRDNPANESLIIGGVTVATPKDVGKYIKSKLQDFGLVRTGLG